MTVTVEVRFPWGRYHATAWDHNANEGVPDWPPAPWRLLRALYASWQWHCSDIDETLVHSLLEKLVVEPRFHLPRHTVAHTRHYLPGPAHKLGVEIDTDKTFDAFVVTERGASLFIEFPTELRAEEMAVLRRLVEQLAYLGRADSLVEAAVVDGGVLPSDGWLEPDPTELPVSGGLRVLSLAAPLSIEALTARPRSVRAARLARPPGTEWLTYARPAADQAPAARPVRRAARTPKAVRYALTGAALPAVEQTVLVADVLRSACLSRYGGDPGQVSPILAGKTADGAHRRGAHGHAHYLPFSADPQGKLLDTIVVWAPDGLPQRELDAVLAVRRLRSRYYADELQDAMLGVEAVGEIDDVAPELCGPASEWRSTTPMVLTRHERGSLAERLAANVQRELSYRDLPDPDQATALDGQWLRFRRHRVAGERRSAARRAHGARLWFATPLAGPLVLGGLSHFGLGLFRPASP